MDTKIQIKLNGIEDVKHFTKLTLNFTSDIDAVSERYIIDAKSILGMFSMNLLNPIFVVIHSADENEIVKFNEAMEKYKV